MKLVMMLAASAMSAGLVLPTVSQGQSDSVDQAAIAAVGMEKAAKRNA